METDSHFLYMQKAYEQALLAGGLDEVPIGCVIVYENKIIGSGYNLRNTKKNTLHHAELTAINEACTAMGDWRLEGCVLYVTIEPCPMCSGAILQSRIDKLVYAAANPKAGCAGSVMNILQTPGFNHRVEIVAGIMEEECAALMRDFFRGRRVKG